VVIPVRIEKLGANHPDTLTTRQHVALLQEAKGNYDLAKKMHEEVFQARTQVLGADHPDTLASMECLGVHYRVRGEYGKAELLLRQAVAGG
jgi:hypothetical protein